MTLLAAEPLVTDPVAICYDADGRAYVAEMNDYPYTDKAKHKAMQENPTDEAIGKIRLLTDEDGDGVFDKSSIFASGLSWPTGVVPWKGGIFVTAAPDFWYLKDTTGDGKADVKEKVLTGYRKYNVQAEVNNPIWGLDNRIYIASASNRGKLYSPKLGADKAIEIGRADVRLDANHPENFELVTGGIQFGNTFDDWGNRFLSNNSTPVYHSVMPLSALSRNPWLPSRRGTQVCPDPNRPIQLYPITGIEAWRLQRYKDRAFNPRSGYKPPRGDGEGEPSRPTSSSAPVIYRGDAYPASHRGMFFVSEPCYNLIYHLKAEANGPTFAVIKPESDGKADFVASRDVWFRPTNLVNAPDGCLHATDLYREAIEHPWSLPESFHARMDLERGRDKGRIYRIEPTNYQHRPAPKLSTAPSPELVVLLAHPNAWHRETAHRLLFERQDKNIVPALIVMAQENNAPLGRLHALWTLQGLASLKAESIVTALVDSNPNIRANAAKIAALHLPEQSSLLPALTALANDPHPTVRYQTALALGNADSKENNPSIAKALITIARTDVADHWIRLALLSSALPHASTMLADLLADQTFTSSAASSELLAPLAQIVGAQQQAAEIKSLIKQLAARGKADSVTLTTAAGFANGLRIGKSSLVKATKETPEGTAFLKDLLNQARSLAKNHTASVAQRNNGIALLRNSTFKQSSAFLQSLLNPAVPEAVQSSAAATLSIIGARQPETGELLLKGWDSYSGELRNQILQLLLARQERLDSLLDAIESKKIAPYQLGPTRRDLLVTHKNAAIAARAKKLFSGSGSRAEVLARYKDVPNLTGDPKKGELIYSSVCIACHKFREKGLVDLAPNLAVVTAWDAERIMTNVIDPNREVAPDYMEYIAQTKSGEIYTGRVVAESGSGITLKMADNSTRDLARSEIASLKNSGRSLMPDGLEAAVSPQAMADLIAFLLAPQ
ncbi:MAG: HEAT repeat domain-containing protein [Verrucomicrobiota bacterium]